MKKFLHKLIVYSVFLIPVICQLSVCADDFSNEIKDMELKLIPFYKNAYNCNKYQTIIHGDMRYQILGVENNACLIKIGAMECRIPKQPLQKWSTLGVQYGRKKLNEISRNALQLSSDEYEIIEAEKIQHMYCNY